MRDMLLPTHLAAIAALSIVSLVHLTGQLFASASFVTQVSQVLLMPALAALLMTATLPPRSRLVQLGLVALLFSWVGDTLPRFLSGDAALLGMIAGFLVAQIVYAMAFYPYRRRSIASKPLLVAPYLAAAVVLLAVCIPGAGVLAVPIIIYAAAIVVMAVLATGLGSVGAVGGVLFLLSDSLIALRAFTDIALPGHSFWVMLTYIAGQILLVHAILGHEERNRPRRDVGEPVVRPV